MSAPRVASGADMPDEDESDLEAERARLDAALLADAAHLNELDEAEENLKIERVEVRVRFGANLDRRLEITPHKQKRKFMREEARRWGFEWRKAHDNRIFARVHRADPERLNCARLAQMTVPEVWEEWRHLNGNDAAAGKIAERRSAQAIDNAVEAFALINARSNQRDLRRLLDLEQHGVKRTAYRAWLSGSIVRQGTQLSEEERRRGLSRLFIDSGAYSELTQDLEIDIDEYCDRLDRVLENPAIPILCANLDHIDHADPQHGALVSYRNFKRMRQRGLDPLAVFHAGEPFYWLEKYIYDEGCQYICLGGVAGPHSTIARNWAFFNKCDEIIAKSGRQIETHAFGVASEATLLHTFPERGFRSSDSAAWLRRAVRFGSTDISRLGDARWRASLDENPDLRHAAKTFLEVWDAQQLERQIREKPERRDFDFFLVVRPEHPFWLPALWTVGHRNALVSNRPGWDTALIKRFIEAPLSVLSEPRYAEMLTLLRDMQARYVANMEEQSRLQRERDDR
jgi:hypothetical protein